MHWAEEVDGQGVAGFRPSSVTDNEQGKRCPTRVAFYRHDQVRMNRHNGNHLVN